MIELATQAGVLALQGDFEPHARVLRGLGCEVVLVRDPAQLDAVTHLVLPGGESTTLHHLLDLFRLWEPIRARHRDGSLALFGTCAGAILLGHSDGAPPPRLDLLDATLARNAYGRQVDSFVAPVEFDGLRLDAVFIRAPKFIDVGPRARVLAQLHGAPVLVEGPRLLAATFHPELSGASRVHERFLALELARSAVQAHSAGG